MIDGLLFYPINPKARAKMADIKSGLDFLDIRKINLFVSFISILWITLEEFD